MKRSALTGKSGTFLMCTNAGPEHGTYSSSPSDYFWLGDDDELTCPECEAPQAEYTSKKVYEPVAS